MNKRRSFVTMIMMVVATIVMVFGVYAATTQNVAITGSLNFEHEVGVKANVAATISGQEETISGFSTSFLRKEETKTNTWNIGNITFVEEDDSTVSPIVLTISVTNVGPDDITMSWSTYNTTNSNVAVSCSGYTMNNSIVKNATITVTFTFTVIDIEKPVENFSINNLFVLKTVAE